MKRMQVTESCFEFLQIAFNKSAADVEIERGNRHTVIDTTHSLDDYEVQVMLLEAHKQCLIILDWIHAVRRPLLFPRGNPKTSGAH